MIGPIFLNIAVARPRWRNSYLEPLTFVVTEPALSEETPPRPHGQSALRLGSLGVARTILRLGSRAGASRSVGLLD